MAAPARVSHLEVSVDVPSAQSADTTTKCHLDFTVEAAGKKGEFEHLSFALSPATLTASLDSLNKVRAQLDGIAKKTKA